MHLDDVLTLVRTRRQLPPAERRRQLREAAGLSQRQVGSAVGVTGSAVALWEAGEREPANVHLPAYAALMKELAADD